MGRRLKFSIFRYNPQDPDFVPHTESFYLEETESLSLYLALTHIREEQDPSLQFDLCCRAGICGACAMMINGRPGLACHTLTKELPDEITLMPLPIFKLIGDLSVDTGTWFRAMHEQVESWVHTDETFDPKAQEERMDNALADEIYELERCIECGSRARRDRRRGRSERSRTRRLLRRRRRRRRSPSPTRCLRSSV